MAIILIIIISLSCDVVIHIFFNNNNNHKRTREKFCIIYQFDAFVGFWFYGHPSRLSVFWIDSNNKNNDKDVQRDQKNKKFRLVQFH